MLFFIHFYSFRHFSIQFMLLQTFKKCYKLFDINCVNIKVNLDWNKIIFEPNTKNFIGTLYHRGLYYIILNYIIKYIIKYCY